MTGVSNESNANRTFQLDAAAVRVLGALMEKEVTTPDNYPLTLNALVAACNQTSNREPVLSLDESAVSRSLDGLAGLGLARGVHRSDSRVRRYRQTFSESMNLHPAENAVMCILLLRGPQTVGEIRGRTNRLFDFVDLRHVEVTLQALLDLPTPLVAELPRRPGQKDSRYAHLMSGEPVEDVSHDATAVQAASPADPDRVEALEAAVDSLRAEVAELRERLDGLLRELQ